MSDILQTITFGHWVLFFGLLSMSGSYLAFRSASPVLAIFSRWLRWIFVALAFAMFAEQAGINRPLWVLVVLGFMLWALIETGYNWLKVIAVSRSTVPLFPRFRNNEAGDEWPNQASFIRLRDTLRGQGFSKRASLKAEIEDITVLRATVYESQDKLIRLTVMFVPTGSSVSTTITIVSETEDGRRLVTDNFFLPYGGYYPENYYLERRPLRRSLNALLHRHMQRMQTIEGSLFAQWEGDPASDINQQQQTLERLNTKAGFLNSLEDQEAYGRISKEGQYRVWKELWLLSYLGISTAG